GHHHGDFMTAGVSNRAVEFPFELGWRVVHSSQRGQGLGGAAQPPSPSLLTAMLAWMSSGRTGMTGGSVTTSLTHRSSPSLNQAVSLALRNASRLPCGVPEAAWAKPGSLKMTHEPWSISLTLRSTCCRSVLTSISV